jgi:hypothetical protein
MIVIIWTGICIEVMPLISFQSIIINLIQLIVTSGAQPDIVNLEWQPCQLLYGPQMGYGNRTSENVHFYVAIFLYNIKLVQFGHAKFSWAFVLLINNEPVI